MEYGRALWSAPAERSGDGAFGGGRVCNLPSGPASQSGVALRLPPHSKHHAQARGRVLSRRSVSKSVPVQ